MGKRVFCLICVGLVFVAVLFPVQVWAQGNDALSGIGSPVLSKGIVKRAPNPLASAMLLVLAGVTISMLFDKKNRH